MEGVILSAHRKDKADEGREAGHTVKVSVGPEEESKDTTDGAQTVAEPEVVTIPAAELEAMKAEIEELKDKYLRTAADFDNFRKRQEKEREELICYANERLIGDLLPILDNLERALGASLDETSTESILAGVRMVSEQLHGVLRSCGLEPIPSVGGRFDPNLHEAVGVLPSGAHDEGTVLSELQRGYALKGKVLRPSMVHVASGDNDVEAG